MSVLHSNQSNASGTTSASLAMLRALPYKIKEAWDSMLDLTEELGSLGRLRPGMMFYSNSDKVVRMSPSVDSLAFNVDPSSSTSL